MAKKAVVPAVENTAPVAAAPVKKAAAKKVVAPVTKVAAPAKKAVVKKVESAPVKVAPAKKAPAAPKDPSALSKPQIRILNALLKSSPLTRKQISETAPVDNAFCTEYLGSLKDEIRIKNDVKLVSLLTHKFIKSETDEELGVVYHITALGKQAVERANKAAAAE